MKLKWKFNWKEMKRWKKIALITLLVFFLFQIPFIYRRTRLGHLRSAIQQLNSQRAAAQAQSAYADYKGVLHVHSGLGGHSMGSFVEIVEAAKANDLHFVVMTEHTSSLLDTSATTLKGVHAGVLFVNGNEVSTASHDRLLLLPGNAEASTANMVGTRQVLASQKTAGSLSLIAYPHEFRSWEEAGFDGIEVYNLYTNTKKINYFVTAFDGLWSYWSYADLMFARFYERPEMELRKWDELTASGKIKLTAVAGNDAHSNVGFRLGDLTGKRLFGLHLDPYERTFKVVRTHVLLEKEKQLNSETLLKAIADGHCYIAFDLFGDATGFTFTAENSQGVKIMGDEIELLGGVQLKVTTPVSSRVKLFRDGRVIRDEENSSVYEFPINERGVYRVELYLTQLGSLVKEKPWIISNPIYVR